MRLADEVRADIQAFASGRIGEHELEGWLDCASAEVHAQKDSDLRALTDRTYSLLAEVSYGDRTVGDARQELAKFVALASGDIGSAQPRAESISARGMGD